MTKEKKLAIWGIGAVCKTQLEFHSELHPDFFIDSNHGGITFKDRPVKKPAEISNWNDIFVLIMVKNYTEIENFLKDKGLKKQIDFETYDNYFGISNLTFNDSIKNCEKFINKNPSYKNSEIIFLPKNSREMQNIITFFGKYCDNGKNHKCIFFCKFGNMTETEMKNKGIFPAFDMPEACYQIDLEIIPNDTTILADSIKEYEKDLETIENCRLRTNSEINESVKQAASYFINVFSILQPNSVAIWGGWLRLNLIQELVCKKLGIKHGFLEHGWIPGTIQFNYEGVAGRCEWARNYKNLVQTLVTENDILEAKKIKAYITEKKLDNGQFYISNEDEQALKKLDNSKKTVFLVGMGEYGMNVNPDSDFWSDYICKHYKSTEYLLYDLAKICKKENLNLIFKAHPDPEDRDLKLIKDMPENAIVVRYTSVDKLIELADAVVSIASAVDYKVLTYEKPLVEVGRMTLQGKDCVYEISEPAQLQEKLMQAIQFGHTEEQKNNFERHIAQLLKTCLWNMPIDKPFDYGLDITTNFFFR